MNKEQLLQELSQKINTGEISREEVTNRLSLETIELVEVKKEESHYFSITKMMYVLGAAIVVIGIVIFVSQIWNDIGSSGRTLVTLGLGFLLAAIGSMLLKSKPGDNIGSVFHFIGGMLVPGGALVTLFEFGVNPVSLWPVTIVFGIIFIFYLLLNHVHKNAILTFFAIANGTVFVYLFIESIIDGPFYQHEDLFVYLTMVIGICYLLLGYAFRDGWNKKLVGLLYFVGITGLLGAAFTRVFSSGIWEILYFVLIVGALFLSVFVRNRSILVMSTIFLIAHVMYITAEYFAHSLGWPISLVILGFVFVGLGYASININKKYIANGA